MSAGATAPPVGRNAPYLVFMLLLSIYAVATLAITSFAELSEPIRTVLGYADTALCALFFVDFLITLARAPNRVRYLLTWGWIDLLSSIPAVGSFRWGRAGRVFAILRVLRGVKATRILGEFILHRRAQSAVLAALLISLLLVVFSACAVLQFEVSPAANIRTPEDALWWAMVTVTTVGYGDKYPLSWEGRLVAVFLMTAGVGLFATFSGFVAAWFLEAPARKSEELDAIRELSRELAEARADIRALEGR